MEMLEGASLGSLDGLAKQLYDTSFEAMVANLMDGTVALGPARRLTAQLIETSGTFSIKLRDSSGNTTSLPNV